MSKLESILKLQKKAIRIILNLKSKTTVKEHCLPRNIMKV